MSDWNTALYLKFERERTQAALDLLAKIPHPNPKVIVDLGCGPGNSTELLRARYPHAENSASIFRKRCSIRLE